MGRRRETAELPLTRAIWHRRATGPVSLRRTNERPPAGAMALHLGLPERVSAACPLRGLGLAAQRGHFVFASPGEVQDLGLGPTEAEPLC